ncbi:MAG: endonuclease/exonuclease/phosphatase family protein [Candidatus Latescibacteria bacterium]|nr:endonuclease/exonuclease/phosphatase family protein [Candidatus Latescibacterota bacterium]
MTATIPKVRRLLLGAAPALVTLAFLAGRAPAGDFTAATLNIWHDQGDWPARRAVILDTLRVLSPDVLFLQEVLEKEGLPNQAQQLADSLGWGFVFASVDPPGAAKRYGNAILTRHRIVATHETMLLPLDDYRVAAHARLEAGGRTVDAYVTHLHHTAEGAHMRAEQVRGLIAFVDSTRGGGDLVLGGDFNAAVDRPELAPLLARYIDCYAALHPDADGETATTLNPGMGHAPARIDHLFVEPGGPRPVAARIFLEAPSPSGVWAADHFGVWARLR